MLAAGALMKKHGMDPTIQDVADRTLPGRGWFLPFNTSSDYKWTRDIALDGFARTIARVLHLEYGSNEESLRTVAADAYARRFVERAADYDSNQMAMAVDAFATAFSAAETWAKANRIQVSFLSPLAFQSLTGHGGAYTTQIAPSQFTRTVVAETNAIFAAEQIEQAAASGTAPPVTTAPPSTVSAPAAVAGVAVAGGIGWLVLSTAGKALLRRYTGINL
jgi:hypothetical protein